MNDKTCWDCGLFSKEQHTCLRTKTTTLSTDSCSHFIEQLPICDMCGQKFLPPINYLMEPNARPITLCVNCLKTISTCNTCSTNGYCDFQQNEECPLPVFVERVVQQGPMVMRETVPNLARIEHTCKKNCKCWNHELNCCNRGVAFTCDEYTMKINLEEFNEVSTISEQ